MSRCFPYPPPGYLRNGSRGDSASVSIKHQSGNTKFAPVQPSSKVKERIQERKCVKVDLKSRCPANKGLRQVKETGKRKWVDSEMEDDTEKSDLSEEHGQPVRVCYSIDKKGDEAASSVPKRTVLRFRLPVKKCKEPDVSVKPNHANAVPLPNAESGVDKAQPCTLEFERDSSHLNVGTSSETLFHRSKKELQYEALFRDWVPLPLQFQIENDNEDWLLGTKKQTRNETKRPEVNNNFECVSSSLWPTARFLPEANIYSLPYTVPF